MTIFLLCVAFSAVGGLIPATLLGSAPLLAPRPALAAASVGLVMQGSNLGQVIGPVTVGAVIDRHGWPSAAWVVVAAGAGGLLIAWGLRRLGRRASHARGSSVLSRRRSHEVQSWPLRVFINSRAAWAAIIHIVNYCPQYG